MESKNTMNERYKEAVQTIFDMAEFYKQVDWEKEDYDQCHAFNVLACAQFLRHSKLSH